MFTNENDDIITDGDNPNDPTVWCFFPREPDGSMGDSTTYQLYLAWRAVGESREQALAHACDGYRPAAWAFLFSDDEENARETIF